jgi:sugar lactone lactonase YvrE
MDSSRFDQFARAFGALRTRRTALWLLGGAAAGPVLSTRDVEAKRKKKRKKPCKAPQKKCGGKCLAVQSDDNNCGACGNRCGRAEICRAGRCEALVPPVDCPIGQCCEDNQVCDGDGRCRDGECRPLPACLSNGETFRQGEGQCCSENVTCQPGTTGADCTCMPGNQGNACLRNGDCRSGRCVGYQCMACPGETEECNGECVSLGTDRNCSACGDACERDYYCQPQQNTMCKPRYQQDRSWPAAKSLEAVFVDETRTVFTVDGFSHFVMQYSESGTHETNYGLFGESGQSSRHFNSPRGVAAYGAFVIIADTGNHRVQIFGRNGGWLASLANGLGSGNYSVHAPLEIAIDKENNIYVADPGNNRVQKFNSSFTYVRSFGSGVGGSGNNQLNQPSGVVVDRHGNVYVADSGNHRVQKFDSQGQYLMTFGSSGTGAGQFNFPASCAVTTTGDLFVLDERNARVQQFAPNGDVIRIFSGSPLVDPTGVAVDKQDNLYIADRRAWQVFRYRLDAPTSS